MAEKVFGLYGPGHGPWVFIKRMPRPRVQISKLLSGSVEVRVSESCAPDADFESRTFTSDGVFEIPSGSYAKAVHEDLSQFLMVNFVS